MNRSQILFIFMLLLLPASVYCDCTCDQEEQPNAENKTTALKLKYGAIGAILISSAIGVGSPILLQKYKAFQPGTSLFFMVKAFAAGVILATGFVHVLPDAFEHLTSPCLNKPWSDFPFTGLIAMTAAIGTLMVDTVATSYFQSLHFNSEKKSAMDEEHGGEHASHVHVHTHATHGHSHGADESSGAELTRHRVISQVLEIGIAVHSVIIGISLGATKDVSTIFTLLIALSCHQLFEGMGLGGCISQAKFKSRAVFIMVLVFMLTTPGGIAIGMAISSVYKENSPTALIVEGVLNSASAGILVYMALVDLLAADFMSAKVQGSMKLFLGVCVCLLLGAGMMSTVAIWA
ncbi:hypothetical protein ACHQM5_007067 [Ranunculus cassubicifolius]